jgi:O-acetyl-ADP-ribose deacetylase (regulator of RNase III)
VGLANRENLESVAIPAISSGIFAYPKVECAKVMFDQVRKFSSTNPSSLKLVRFTNLDDETYNIFMDELNRIKENKDI